MPKIYFVVSSLGTHKGVTMSLVELYKSNNKVCVEQRMGGPKGLPEYGVRPPEGILIRLNEVIQATIADAIVFNGWRIAESIEHIYPEFKSKATFIFTKETSPGSVSQEIRFAAKYASDEQISSIVADQKSKIEKVISDNSLNLTYRQINPETSCFEGNVLNSESGPTQIAVLGNLL